MPEKPVIIVLSKDEDDTFRWQSDGWNYTEVCNTTEAKRLMALARMCIKAGKDVPDTIKKLKIFGFGIRRL